MAETTFSPLTDRGSQLLDQLQAEAQLYPFRTTADGALTSLAERLDGDEGAAVAASPETQVALDKLGVRLRSITGQ